MPNHLTGVLFCQIFAAALTAGIFEPLHRNIHITLRANSCRVWPWPSRRRSP
jgi:hypothetical protein